MTRFHVPNVESCNVITIKMTPLIGAYVPPTTLEHLLELVEELTHFQDN